YEQMQKDFMNLKSNFRNLENDFHILSEDKIHVEYELRVKDKSDESLIENLKQQKEKLLMDLQASEEMNTKLTNENQNLKDAIQGKESEYSILFTKFQNQNKLIPGLKEKNEKNQQYLERLRAEHQNDENQQEQILNALNVTNKKYLSDNSKLILSEEENNKLLKQIEEMKANNDNLIAVLKDKEIEENRLKDALYSNNEFIEAKKQDLENLNNERNIKMGELKNIKLTNQNTLNEIQNHLNKLEDIKQSLDLANNKEIKMSNENKAIETTIEQNIKEIDEIQKRIEAYQKHILVVSHQNELLSNEIESCLNRDIRIRKILERTERLRGMIYDNKDLVEQVEVEKTLTNLNSAKTTNYTSKSQRSFVSNSPGRTYNIKSNS
ncbi:MAG: hypothetical protein MJ252_00965, partial [archaeon]|nr:hypothetical protein [archaeon]